MRKLELLWGTAVLLALLGLARYQSTPGVAANAPERWPVKLAMGPRGTLVLVLHPKCPCSGASLDQLERVLDEATVKPKVYVLFASPAGSEASFHQTDLYSRACGLAGVVAVDDRAGALSRLFGSQTSGQALFYDASGRLAFSGGLTLFRGHSGDSVGLDTLLSLLSDPRRREIQQPLAPVYGCPLFSKEEEFCQR